MNSQQSAATPMNAPKSAASPMNTRQPATTASTKSILSVDLGRTSTKACVGRDPEGVVFIPANVAHLPVDKVRSGTFESRPTDPLLDMWIEYQGSGYAVGQLAADFGAKLYREENQSKVEDALAKVLACVGYFGTQLKDIDDLSVVISLPYQDQFEQEKEQLTNLLVGPHVVKYRGEELQIHIRKVWIMPEGYGSLIWCEAQGKKAPGSDFTNLSVGIVDIGHQTSDCLVVDKFRFARGLSKSEAFAMSQFYEQVAAQIEGADPQSLSLIEAVNKPKGERFYRPRGALKPTNLDDILPNLKESFSRQMCERILAWVPERVTDVILTGGGGEFFAEDIQRLLKDARINAHSATPSRQANALGQYIYGEAQLAAAPATRSTTRS